MALRLLLLVVVTLSTFAQSSEDAKFAAVAKDFIEKMLENFPEGATALGDHRFDGKLTDWSSAGRTRVIEVRRECLKSLSGIDRAKLMPVNRLDYDILQNHLEGGIWSFTVSRDHEWNPMLYNRGSADLSAA